MASKRWTLKTVAQVAAEERDEMEVAARSVMDPYALADRHGVECYPIDELPCDSDQQPVVDHFLIAGQAAWSAALVPLGTARVVIENPSHTPQRRRVSVAHELGHFLLEHDFAASLLTAEGGRLFDETQEKHADHFACQLLVPDDDAVWAAFRDYTNNDVAEHFNVSDQFANWRMVRARQIVKNYRSKIA